MMGAGQRRAPMQMPRTARRQKSQRFTAAQTMVGVGQVNPTEQRDVPEDHSPGLGEFVGRARVRVRVRRECELRGRPSYACSCSYAYSCLYSIMQGRGMESRYLVCHGREGTHRAGRSQPWVGGVRRPGPSTSTSTSTSTKGVRTSRPAIVRVLVLEDAGMGNGVSLPRLPRAGGDASCRKITARGWGSSSTGPEYAYEYEYEYEYEGSANFESGHRTRTRARTRTRTRRCRDDWSLLTS